MNAMRLQRKILAWYSAHKRDLPWRKTIDPYKILISEVMLQQTQVATVIPYYEKWIKRFPRVESLAENSQPEILKYWAGLGYYRRARMLHEAAKIIVKNDGPVALYDLNVLILFDTKIETEKTIAILPVYGKQEYQVSIPFSILGVNTPQNIKVVVGGNSLTAPSSKNWVILMSLATIFLIIGLTIGFIYWRVKIHENNS